MFWPMARLPWLKPTTLEPAPARAVLPVDVVTPVAVAVALRTASATGLVAFLPTVTLVS